MARLQRRDFLRAATATTALGLAGRSSSAASPNQKLRTAHIGVGGMGQSDLRSVASHASVEVAAVCDVDSRAIAKAREAHPNAKSFRDFREMLDQLGDSIDAVVVSTPDHTHAPAAMLAMNLGKPVYCQKPLTHDVYESRQLRLKAESTGIVTQMGIQVHASQPYRMATEMIQSGVIGKVSRVHAWSAKNWGYDGEAFQGEHPVPDFLEWDLWLGTAQERPYHNGVYHGGQWRKLIDFGTGTLGDMGVHIFDTPFRALALKKPLTVKTTCRPPTGVGHPEKNRVTYQFEGTEYTTDQLEWNWYDGGFAPPNAKEIGVTGVDSLPGQGALFIGETGQLLLPHVAAPVLLPEAKFADVQRPNLEPLNHYHQWVDACMDPSTTKTSAHFGYGGRLTEALLLGVVANRFPNTTLEWDADAMKVTNVEAANALLKREYRDGYQIEGLG